MYRLRGLFNAELMLDALARCRAERMRQEKRHDQTAAAAHLRAHGHELRFGCCKP